MGNLGLDGGLGGGDSYPTSREKLPNAACTKTRNQRNETTETSETTETAETTATSKIISK